MAEIRQLLHISRQNSQLHRTALLPIFLMPDASLNGALCIFQSNIWNVAFKVDNRSGREPSIMRQCRLSIFFALVFSLPTGWLWSYFFWKKSRIKLVFKKQCWLLPYSRVQPWFIAWNGAFKKRLTLTPKPCIMIAMHLKRSFSFTHFVGKVEM